VTTRLLPLLLLPLTPTTTIMTTTTSLLPKRQLLLVAMLRLLLLPLPLVILYLRFAVTAPKCYHATIPSLLLLRLTTRSLVARDGCCVFGVVLFCLCSAIVCGVRVHESHTHIYVHTHRHIKRWKICCELLVDFGDTQ